MGEPGAKLVPLPQPRDLREEELALVGFLLAGPLGTEELRRQAEVIRVSGVCTFRCPSIQLEVDRSAPSTPFADGDLPLKFCARGVNAVGIEVEVGLRVVSGRLVELEIWAGEFGPALAPALGDLRYDEKA